MNKQTASVLIPTFNRPQELAYLLSFLQLQGSQYNHYVLDGSKQENQIKNSAIIKNFSNVTHMQFPENTHMSKRICDCIDKFVTTKYTILCADDDFLIPNFVEKGIDFLENHPDYSAVSGLVRCLAYPRRAHKYGLFTFINHLPVAPSMEQSSFLARYHCSNVMASIGAPPLFYSLRHTEHTRKIFGLVNPNFKYSSQEILNGALTLIFGKCTTLPNLMLIRNYSSITIREPIRDDPTYYTTESDIQCIRKIIKTELLSSDKEVSEDIAEYILDQFFTIPLTKYTCQSQEETQTPLRESLNRKKNWLFYCINFFLPSFMKRLDPNLNANIVRDIGKAFRRSQNLIHAS